MSAEWRPVVGYEGFYSVSSTGKIWSFFRCGRVLRPASQVPHGHMHVNLNRDGKRETHSVHRLVARAFIGEPTGPLVRHIDGNARNNNLANLAYGTSSENNLDTVRHGHNPMSTRTKCVNGHPFTEDNTYRAPGYSRRDCRTCIRARVAKYKARKMATS